MAPASGALRQQDIGAQLILIQPHVVPGAVGTLATSGIWLTEHWGHWEGAGGTASSWSWHP